MKKQQQFITWIKERIEVFEHILDHSKHSPKKESKFLLLTDDEDRPARPASFTLHLTTKPHALKKLNKYHTLEQPLLIKNGENDADEHGNPIIDTSRQSVQSHRSFDYPSDDHRGSTQTNILYLQHASSKQKQRFYRFLNQHDLTTEKLKELDLTPEVVFRVFCIEFSFWNVLRWCHFDTPERLFYFIQHMHLQRFSSVRFAQAHKAISINGRSLPLQSIEKLAAIYAINGFRQGFEFAVCRMFKLFFFSLLGYQVIEGMRRGTILDLDTFLGTIDSANVTSILWSIRALRTREGHITIGCVLALPFIWGGAKALLRRRDAKPLTTDDFSNFKKILLHKRGNKTNCWHDKVRWFLPLHPQDTVISRLVQEITWNGRLDDETRLQYFNLFREWGENSTSYSWLVFVYHLSKLAHGISLRELHILQDFYKGSTATLLLKIKLYAFLYLQEYATPDKNKSFFARIYIHYLKWSLADSINRLLGIFMSLFKAGKIAFNLTIFQAIFAAFTKYFECPTQEGFDLGGGPANWMAYFSETCLNAYFRLFNVIQGQPPDTLITIFKFVHLNQTNPNDSMFFRGNYTVDLSNKGINGTVAAAIIAGLIAHNIRPVIVNLAHNHINTPEDMRALTPVLFATEELNLAGNELEHVNSAGTVALAEGMHFMKELRKLQLWHNRIGRHDDRGIKALGENFPKVLHLNEFRCASNNDMGSRSNHDAFEILIEGLSGLPLIVIDFSGNQLDGVNAKAFGVFFQRTATLEIVNLGSNQLGDDNVGIITLFDNFKCVHIKKLFLRGNSIRAPGIFSLATAISAKNALNELDLSNNEIILDPDNQYNYTGFMRLMQNLQQCPLKILKLGSNFLDSGAATILSQVFQNFRQLQILDLYNNKLSSNHTAFALLINSLKGSPLVDLSLSSNKMDDLSAAIVGSILPSLTFLRILNMRDDPIGAGKGFILFAEGLKNSPLTTLYLYMTGIGSAGSAEPDALATVLPTLPNLKKFSCVPFTNGTLLLQTVQRLGLAEDFWPLFTTPAEAKNYVASLPISTTTLNMNDKLAYVSEETTIAFFLALPRLLNLKNLYFNAPFLTSLAVKQAFAYVLGVLPNLEQLILLNAGLGENSCLGDTDIYQAIGKMPKLVKLDISENDLDNCSIEFGILMQSVKKLKQLKTLLMKYTFQMRGTIWKAWETLTQYLALHPSLQELDLGTNGMDADNIPKIIFDFLATLPALTNLNLQGNGIGKNYILLDSLRSVLQKMTGVKKLYLRSNWIGQSNNTASFFQAFSSLHLQVLDLGQNRIDGPNFFATQQLAYSLESMTDLSELYLDNNKLDIGIPSLGYISNLGIIALANSLLRLINLQILDLDGSNIGNAGPEGPRVLLAAIAKLLKLQDFRISGLKNVPWTDLAAAYHRIYEATLRQQCEDARCNPNVSINSDFSRSQSLPLPMQTPILTSAANLQRAMPWLIHYPASIFKIFSTQLFSLATPNSWIRFAETTLTNCKDILQKVLYSPDQISHPPQFTKYNLTIEAKYNSISDVSISDVIALSTVNNFAAAHRNLLTGSAQRQPPQYTALCVPTSVTNTPFEFNADRAQTTQSANHSVLHQCMMNNHFFYMRTTSTQPAAYSEGLGNCQRITIGDTAFAHCHGEHSEVFIPASEPVFLNPLEKIVNGNLIFLLWLVGMLFQPSHKADDETLANDDHDFWSKNKNNFDLYAVIYKSCQGMALDILQLRVDEQINYVDELKSAVQKLVKKNMNPIITACSQNSLFKQRRKLKILAGQAQSASTVTDELCVQFAKRSAKLHLLAYEIHADQIAMAQKGF